MEAALNLACYFFMVAIGRYFTKERKRGYRALTSYPHDDADGRLGKSRHSSLGPQFT